MAKIQKERSFYGDEPEKLLDWPAWIAGLIADIPEADRESARFGVDQGYDHYGHLELTWMHEETEEELAEKARQAELYAVEQRERELREYERLRAKLGKP